MSTAPARPLQVPQTILIFAFRYALGRRSPGVGAVADELVHQAPRLEAWQRAQIVRDIRFAIAHDQAGDPCDVEAWRGVLDLFVSLDEGTEAVVTGG